MIDLTLPLLFFFSYLSLSTVGYGRGRAWANVALHFKFPSTSFYTADNHTMESGHGDGVFLFPFLPFLTSPGWPLEITIIILCSRPLAHKICSYGKTSLSACSSFCLDQVQTHLRARRYACLFALDMVGWRVQEPRNRQKCSVIVADAVA